MHRGIMGLGGVIEQLGQQGTAQYNKAAMTQARHDGITATAGHIRASSLEQIRLALTVVRGLETLRRRFEGRRIN
jgi:hypothetical protein